MPGWTHTATTSNSAELTTHGHGASWVTQGANRARPKPTSAGPHYPWDPLLGMGPVAHTLTWLVPPQHLRLPDQRTQVGQSSLESAQRPRLDEEVPDGCGLDGPGHDRQSARISCELTQQLVPRTSADEMERVDVPAGNRKRRTQRPPMRQGQTFDDRPDHRRRRVRDRLPGSPTDRGDPGR